MSFIILDRDGVINYDSDSYIKSPAEWQAIPGSLEAIAKLNQAGFRVLIATNQSGVGRGLYDLEMLDQIHQKLKQELSLAGGEIEAIYFCPHTPDDECVCRKPKPGLIDNMTKHYQINLSQTFFIGDSIVDVQAALDAGCQPLLVRTGNGEKTIQQYSILNPLPNFLNLERAVEYVLSR